MLRLWFDSYRKQTSQVAGVTVSVVAHTALIAGAVVATLPAANVPESSIANRVYYIPPPDRVGGQEGSRETVHYIDVMQPAIGIGDGLPMAGDTHSVKLDRAIGKSAPDTTTTPEVVPLAGPPDSVFSILQVDTAVVRSANSAAPAYPLNLLQARITGAVSAQYVVDTTGFADTASFRVLNDANPGFVSAVRSALPYMRFLPAKIGEHKVKQLVEQQFTFRIADTTALEPPAKLPGKKKP